MNHFITGLSGICGDHLLDEKWLLAPSLRAGHQWLVTVARACQPVVNCHVKTPINLALELAAPAMAARGVELVSARAGELLVDRIMRQLLRAKEGYLAKLPPSAGLARSVYAAIDALRRAGLDTRDINPAVLEVADKGKELAVVLNEYLQELVRRSWVDRAEVLRMALERLKQDSTALPEDVLILVPEDIDCRGLEGRLLEALPAERKRVLLVDQPGQPLLGAGGRSSDAGLLRWLSEPISAPPPARDGSANLFRAVGEVNEVREVLRRCLAAGHAVDEVEILTTDVGTHVPLIYEAFAELLPEGTSLDDMPVTFHEGIAARQFRPGRALVAWLAWVRADCPQAGLVEMIREGLLTIPEPDADKFSFSRLAAVLRGIPIGLGRARYLSVLDEQIRGLEMTLADREQLQGEDGEIDHERVRILENRLDAIQVLRRLVTRLLDLSPGQDPSSDQVLASARRFVEELARAVVRLDNFARNSLRAEISDLAQCLSVEKDTSLDVWDWLAALPGEARVGGSGPRGGCLHVADVLAGGHSGRAHTFVVGLDDGRFPGAGLQDHILLDSERHQLSPELATAAGQLQKRLERFYRLMARLRGTVTLSYSCHNLSDDREMFPSPVLLSAFRILSGNREGDQADMMQWLEPPASFAPDNQKKALGEAEWWLWRLSGPAEVTAARPLVTGRFPHLGRGYRAAEQRRSSVFTIFDGHIPDPGPALDPTADSAAPVSASRLEALGTCPLRYFFRYVLKIEPPEELEIDLDVWLDPLALGTLLHKVLEGFMRELSSHNQLPVYRRDETRLLEMLDEAISVERKRAPPPSEDAFRKQHQQLQTMVRIFLREEEEYWQKTGRRSLYLEVLIGMELKEAATDLDTAEAVQVRLPGGKHLRVCGRIDRVERTSDGTAFSIWDYKSGSSWKYTKEPPFWQGRVVQHALYLKMLQARLEALGDKLPGARATDFGFLFLGERDPGARQVFTPDQLADGGLILERLAGIPAAGAFLATDCADDCKYCDYKTICRDFAAVTEASQKKLNNPANTVLQPFLELRRHGQE
jgi:ATP-dependent helicase/nuclease subunit B